MNKHILKPTLITIGFLGVIGAVGTQAYYSHELADRLAAQESAPVLQSTAAPGAHPLDPWAAIHADMMRMQAQMDQAFNGTFRDMHGTGLGGQDANAQVTVEEQGDNYVVKADIPGAKESDINVNLNGRLLSISSATKGGEQQKADNGQIVRQESYASSFQQALTLPGPVNASGMQTQFRDGILTVTIPKVAA
jgi:HSP20 family protein